MDPAVVVLAVSITSAAMHSSYNNTCSLQKPASLIVVELTYSVIIDVDQNATILVTCGIYSVGKPAQALRSTHNCCGSTRGRGGRVLKGVVHPIMFSLVRLALQNSIHYE